MSGKLPSALGSLSALEELLLHDNMLTGAWRGVGDRHIYAIFGGSIVFLNRPVPARKFYPPLLPRRFLSIGSFAGRSEWRHRSTTACPLRVPFSPFCGETDPHLPLSGAPTGKTSGIYFASHGLGSTSCLALTQPFVLPCISYPRARPA